MEQGKRKRGREADANQRECHHSEMSLRKKEKHVEEEVGQKDSNDDGNEASSSSGSSNSRIINTRTSDSRLLSLEIFDFPWLTDSLISKSVDWTVEDVFSSALIETTTIATIKTSTVPCTGRGGIEFLDESLCQDQESLIDLPEEKFEENVWWPFEGEGPGTDRGVDCS